MGGASQCFRLQTIGKFVSLWTDENHYAKSGTMGNKGAFLNLTGESMVPKYIVYEAVIISQQKSGACQNFTDISLDTRVHRLLRSLRIVGVNTIFRIAPQKEI
ncbi:hypothetical protein HUJ05_002586 [Dendroctonus ponderosae]|nr:hypothetical protein HUJ05_002586 [Dendroctonus ponderosae]